jgi:uncharacterized protein (TIGR00159 family)
MLLGFLQLRWLDALDILLVAILLYQLYRLVRGTVAIRIFLGILTLLIVWKLLDALQMELVSNILGQFIGIGAIAVIIIFQPELRTFLIRIGTRSFLSNSKLSIFRPKADSESRNEGLTIIQTAINHMSATKTGALIVLTGEEDYTKIHETGVRLDAAVNSDLIESIFHKSSALHDGAMLIENERVAFAGCVLPVSERKGLPRHYGLRHRAALGMAEAMNSMALIVSEETGKVSIAQNGKLETLKEPGDAKMRMIAYYNQ